MKIEIRRKWFTDNSTIGKLLINGAFLCYTLEDKMREVPGQDVRVWKVQNKTAIPVGTYPLIIDRSMRFKRDMFHILNVPGFDGIRIHSGNTDKDTDGCILVGSTYKSTDEIEDSRVALAMLWAKLAIPFPNTGHPGLDIEHWQLREPSEITITNEGA